MYIALGLMQTFFSIFFQKEWIFILLFSYANSDFFSPIFVTVNKGDIMPTFLKVWMQTK